MDTRNGVTLLRLSIDEWAAGYKPQQDRMTQEAKALGNARDKLTWVRS
jgi:hypothetical protein